MIKVGHYFGGNHEINKLNAGRFSLCKIMTRLQVNAHAPPPPHTHIGPVYLNQFSALVMILLYMYFGLHQMAGCGNGEHTRHGAS